MEFSMRTVLMTAVSTAVCAFVAAGPAFAQDTVTGAPAGQAPVTVEGYGYMQGQTGQPGIGNDYPAGYGYESGYGWPGYGPGYGFFGWIPFAPVGAAAAGVGALGAGVASASGSVAGEVANTATYPLRRHCHVNHNGRRVCGP
jgi:hypothetical protein